MSLRHPRTIRTAVSFLMALVVALIGLATTSAPATADTSSTPIVVGSPSDVPAGAVEDVPSQYQTAGECDTTRSWTLVVPPTTKQQYRHPLEKRTYTPGTAEVSHQEYKYKKTVPAVEGVKEYRYRKAIMKTQYWAKYQKHVAGRVEKWNGSSWYDTGSDFGWTKWEGDFWNTTGSFQTRDWADAASPDVIEEGGHGGVSDSFTNNGYTYRHQAERYSYRVIERLTRQVSTGTYEYSAWTTQVWGAPWEKVEERWQTEPKPAYDVYYNNGGWTRDVLGSPWVRIAERKVVDSAAVPASFGPWTFDAWTAWSDTSAAPADPDGQDGETNPLNLRRVGTPMQQQTVQTAAGYTHQYVWSDGKACAPTTSTTTPAPPTTTPTTPTTPTDTEVLEESASGKAVGSLKVSCQGTVRVTMRNGSSERVAYTVKIAKEKRKINVPSGKTRTWVTSAAPRDRAQLWLGDRLLASKRLPKACVAPEVLPETGLRG